MRKYEERLVSLRQVIRAIDLYSKKLSKETGLTSPQLLVLQAIADHDDAMVKEVAETINLSSATITSILDRLEKRQLVTRTRSVTDKRKVGIRLTEQGKDILKDSPKPLLYKRISLLVLSQWRIGSSHKCWPPCNEFQA